MERGGGGRGLQSGTFVDEITKTLQMCAIFVFVVDFDGIAKPGLETNGSQLARDWKKFSFG